jgi:hypothetical protein
MKLTRATILLKAVLVLSAILLGFVVFGGVPGFMQHVIDTRPDLAGWDYPMRGYGLLMALPVWAVMGLLWQVFDTVLKNDSFCAANVKRFRQIAWLAVGDLALAVALGAFLVISAVSPPFIMMWLMVAVYTGIVAVIVFYVLAGLLQNAVALKQDSDMTI